MNPVNPLFTGSANKPSRVQQLRQTQNTQSRVPWLDPSQIQAQLDQSLVEDMEDLGFDVSALRPRPVNEAYSSLTKQVREMSEPQERCISGHEMVGQIHLALLKDLKRFKEPEIIDARKALRGQYMLGERLLTEYYTHLQKAGSRFDALQRNRQLQGAKREEEELAYSSKHSDDLSVAYSTLKKSASEMVGTYNRTANNQEGVVERQHALSSTLQLVETLPDKKVKVQLVLSAIEALNKAYGVQNGLYRQCRDGQVRLLQKQAAAINAQRLLMDEWEMAHHPDKVKERQEEMARRIGKLDIQG